MHLFRPLAIATLVCTVGLAGCVLPKKTTSSPTSVTEAAFSASDTFSRTYGSSPENSCEAARRALLSQAYLMTEVAPTRLSARKNFQQTREQHYEVEFHVTCVPNPGQSSTIFVSAVQQLYGLRKTSSSASVGVGILGSLSVPVMSEDDSMIKIGSVTLTKPDLYQRFFDLVENHLAAMSAMPDNAASAPPETITPPALAPHAVPITPVVPEPEVHAPIPTTTSIEEPLNPGISELIVVPEVATPEVPQPTDVLPAPPPN